MSQNYGSNDPTSKSPTRSTGGAGTGATDAGTTRDTSTSMTPSGSSAGGSSGLSTGAAPGVKAQAQEYGQKVADAATQAKDYVADKMSVVGDKFKDLQNKDFTQVADEAKEYARQKPGQALLISAAAGFVIGLLIRGSNRR
ncbi:MAG TPA: DUF883 C-terminal domain-containing protein [Pyrinomonadaceae bacterium]|nr:DUF883 C-terminal domain-containing protein [Pyrinomonadaceae bacterium]